MTSMLQTLGHRIDEAPNDRTAVRMLEHAPVDLVLAGANPDDPDALEFLTYLRRKYPRVAVILVFPIPHREMHRSAPSTTFWSGAATTAGSSASVNR